MSCEVVQLAVQKVKAWKRKEVPRTKMHRFGSMFGVGRIKLPSRARLAVM
jgi:hypothetical protein